MIFPGAYALDDLDSCRVVLRRSRVATATFVCLFLLSLACLVGAVDYAFDQSAVRAREAKVNRYIEAVQEWTRNGRPRFQRMSAINAVLRLAPEAGNFNASASDVLFNVTPIPSTQADALRDPDARTLPSYEALQYAFNPAGINTMVLAWRNWPAVLTVSYEGAAGPRSFSYPFELTRVLDVSCSTWKATSFKMQGAVYSNRCYIYQKVKAVCLRLHWTADEEWQPQRGTAGLGCLPPHWEAVQYRRIVLDKYGMPSTVSLDVPFTIALRADSDPWMVAHWLTNGALDFGITVQAHRNVVRLLCVSAVACLLGCGILVSCCCLQCGYYEPGEEPLIRENSHNAAYYNRREASTAVLAEDEDLEEFLQDKPRSKKKKKKKHVTLAVEEERHRSLQGSPEAGVWQAISSKVFPRASPPLLAEEEMTVTPSSDSALVSLPEKAPPTSSGAGQLHADL